MLIKLYKRLRQEEQVWTTKILSQYLIGNDYWWLYYTVVK